MSCSICFGLLMNCIAAMGWLFSDSSTNGFSDFDNREYLNDVLMDYYQFVPKSIDFFVDFFVATITDDDSTYTEECSGYSDNSICCVGESACITSTLRLDDSGDNIFCDALSACRDSTLRLNTLDGAVYVSGECGAESTNIQSNVVCSGLMTNVKAVICDGYDSCDSMEAGVINFDSSEVESNGLWDRIFYDEFSRICHLPSDMILDLLVGLILSIGAGLIHKVGGSEDENDKNSNKNGNNNNNDRDNNKNGENNENGENSDNSENNFGNNGNDRNNRNNNDGDDNKDDENDNNDKNGKNDGKKEKKRKKKRNDNESDSESEKEIDESTAEAFNNADSQNRLTYALSQNWFESSINSINSINRNGKNVSGRIDTPLPDNDSFFCKDEMAELALGGKDDSFVKQDDIGEDDHDDDNDDNDDDDHDKYDMECNKWCVLDTYYNENENDSMKNEDFDAFMNENDSTFSLMTNQVSNFDIVAANPASSNTHGESKSKWKSKSKSKSKARLSRIGQSDDTYSECETSRVSQAPSPPPPHSFHKPRSIAFGNCVKSGQTQSKIVESEETEIEFENEIIDSSSKKGKHRSKKSKSIYEHDHMRALSSGEAVTVISMSSAGGSGNASGNASGNGGCGSASASASGTVTGTGASGASCASDTELKTEVKEIHGIDLNGLTEKEKFELPQGRMLRKSNKSYHVHLDYDANDFKTRGVSQAPSRQQSKKNETRVRTWRDRSIKSKRIYNDRRALGRSEAAKGKSCDMGQSEGRARAISSRMALKKRHGVMNKILEQDNEEDLVLQIGHKCGFIDGRCKLKRLLKSRESFVLASQSELDPYTSMKIQAFIKQLNKEIIQEYYSNNQTQ